MTKNRIITLTAILLLTVMTLSSCSAGGALKLKGILDGSLYKAPVAFTTATTIPDVQDAEFKTSSGSLVYFVNRVNTEDDYHEKHTVYNIETGSVVFGEMDSDTVSHEIEIHYANTLNDEAAFYSVKKTTYATEGNDINYAKSTVATTIYNADGSQIASTEHDCTPETSYDLLRFDGKCYRLGEDGKYAYAFDHSSLSNFPFIIYATKDLYVAYMNSFMSASSIKFGVYDKQLNIVSTYTLPSYIEPGEGVILENGNLLFQGLIEEEPHTEEYDVYMDETKYSLFTFILDVKKGKIDEIDFEYVIDGTEIITNSVKEYIGINDKVANFVMLSPIENKRVDENVSRIATLDKSGKPMFLEQFNGMNIDEIELVATNRWWISTDMGTQYIINEKAEIVGDVSEASMMANYLSDDGKLYDFDLNVVPDYASEKLVLVNEFDNSLLFKNLDGELILFTNGQKTTLAAKDSKREFFDLSGCNGYFAIVDHSEESKVKFEIYNSVGNNILTLDQEAFTFEISNAPESFEGADILCVTDMSIDMDEMLEGNIINTTYYLVK